MNPFVNLSRTFSFPVSDIESFKFRQPSRPERAIRARLGLDSANIYWSKYQPRNFGDWITPYLYTKLTGRTPIYQRPEGEIRTVLGAGSIFRHIKAANSAVVWGSGLISKEDTFAPPKEIRAVRGPYSKKTLHERGFACPDSFGDPGLLLPRVYQADNISVSHSLGIIPHFKEIATAHDLRARLATDEVIVIDPTQPIENIINQIHSCQCVVSSSLHGLIVCHAYGTRCGWVRLNPRWNKKIEGDDIKFLDHMAAIGLDSQNAPYYVDGEQVSVHELLDQASRNATPDPTNLIENLEKTCPFS